MDSPPSLKLVILQGPREGEAVEFRFGSTVKIGRVVRCNNLPIKDAGISTKHLVIESLPESNRWTLTDLDSSNGTILNSVKLSPHAPIGLNDGDVLKLGEYTSIMVKLVPVVGDEECLGSMPRRNPRRGAVRAKTPRVEVEVAKLDQGDGRPPRNPTRRGKGKNAVVEVENVEGNNSSESGRVDGGENPSQQVGTNNLEEESLQLNPKKQVSTNNVKIKVELESEEMPEGNKSPEVEVKRPRVRPPRNGGVVARVTRSRSRMDEVESMDLEKGKEVVQKKMRGGAAGRGKGRGRRGNSKNVAQVDEAVEVVKGSESTQIQIVENKEDGNSGRNVGVGEEGGERGKEEQGSGEEPRNGSHKEKKDDYIELIREGDSKENDNVEVVRHSDSEKRKNDDSVVIGNSDSKKKKDDNVVVNGDSDSKNKENDNIDIIPDSDEEELAASDKKADGGSHGKAAAGNGLDWQMITVGEWLDHLDVILPKQIRVETEKMIDEMRTKAERVKNYMIEQKMKAKEKEIAKCS